MSGGGSTCPGGLGRTSRVLGEATGDGRAGLPRGLAGATCCGEPGKGAYAYPVG